MDPVGDFLDSIFLCFLGGGFKYFLFSPLFGEDSHFAFKSSCFLNTDEPPMMNH